MYCPICEKNTIVFNVGDGKLADIVCTGGCSIERGSALFNMLSRIFNLQVDYQMEKQLAEEDYRKEIARLWSLAKGFVGG